MSTDRDGVAGVDELRALLEAATPGPWERGEIEHYSESSHGAQIHFAYCAVEPNVAAGVEPEDAALIVAAVNALPGLLDRLAAVEVERDAWEESSTNWQELHRQVGAENQTLKADHRVIWERPGGNPEIVCSCGVLLSVYGLTRSLASVFAQHVRDTRAAVLRAAVDQAVTG